MAEKSVIAIVMAGGLGKRMGSTVPKVLHKIDGIPMINHLLLKLKSMSENINVEKILIVVGKYKDQIKESIEEYICLPNLIYVTQPEPLGTGNAIQCCRDELQKYPTSDVLILSGDVPLLSITTMMNLLSKTSKVKIIITHMDNAAGYGRIVIKNDKFVKIIEDKDCDETQLRIQKVNTGIYCIDSSMLYTYLPYLKNDNKQSEFYLTDIVEIIKREEDIDIKMVEIEKEKSIEIMGVNTLEQLKELEILIKKLK
jgi:bifunctional UDP-N-acetylglucosamine pyrophosphorylase/glucosamine-1-phosphate N-acetyltransferase